MNRLGAARQLRAWASSDIALAVVLLVATVADADSVRTFGISSALSDTVRPLDGLGLALAAVQCAPLALRHRYPDTVLAAVSAAYLADDVLNYPPVAANFAVLVVLYQAGADNRPGRTGRRVAAVVLLTCAVVYGLRGLVYLGCVLAIWLVGRARAAEQQRIEAARGAERRAIALDLHDVISHHVGIMAVQAGVARQTLATRPEEAGRAITAVEVTGRMALDELRQLLGVLRRERAPYLGLAQVPDLVARIRQAGLTVDVELVGEPRALGERIEGPLYRVVQEALTNTVRHAQATTARVMIEFSSDTVRLRIEDDGRARPGGPADADSHGLRGMRERVEALGGRLDVGPTAPHGFTVRAEVPVP